jgi:hypothetical protein
MSVAASDDTFSTDSESESETEGECLPIFESVGSWSNLRCPELIVPEAFEPHPLRVQRQIAAVTGMDLDSVIAQLAEAHPDLAADQHFTPRDIMRFAEHRCIGVFLRGRAAAHGGGPQKRQQELACLRLLVPPPVLL